MQEYELIKYPWHQSADLRALTFLLGVKIVSLNAGGLQLLRKTLKTFAVFFTPTIQLDQIGSKKNQKLCFLELSNSARTLGVGWEGLKCIYQKCIFVKCTRLMHRLRLHSFGRPFIYSPHPDLIPDFLPFHTSLLLNFYYFICFCTFVLH